MQGDYYRELGAGGGRERYRFRKHFSLILCDNFIIEPN